MRYENRRLYAFQRKLAVPWLCILCHRTDGFHRQLSSGEIVEQVLNYARQLAMKGEQVSNVVVMGWESRSTTMKPLWQLSNG